MRKLFFIVGALILGMFDATGQELWTLEKCVDYALENNVQLKSQKLDIRLAEATKEQSLINFAPNLNGSANHGWNWGQTVDPFTNSFATDRVRSNRFAVSSNLSLFKGFQKVNTYRKNQIDLLVARYNVQDNQEKLMLNIVLSYLQVLFNKEMVTVADEQLAVTEQQVERMQKLVQAGTAARGDLLNIRAQASTEELRVVEAVNQRDMALLDLSQLLDLPTVQGFDVEVPDFDMNDIANILENPDRVYAFAKENHPMIKSAEMYVESSLKSLALARSLLSPALSMYGSIGTGYSGNTKDVVDATMLPADQWPVIGQTQNGVPVTQMAFDYNTEVRSFDKQWSDNVNKQLFITLEIPIFNGWQARNQISQAKIGIERARYQLQSQNLALNKIIQQAWADASAAIKKYTAAQQKVMANKESFNYAREKWEVGLINFVDYNNNKKELANAESELLRAKYDYVFRTRVLDYYMGKPIKIK